MERRRICIAGGGAAGFFAAITCAERLGDRGEVIILEKGRSVLAKVLISGGGRCNVTHACFDPAQLVRHYPRGARELLSAFHRWQVRDTVEWFETRGVALKTEADGRMFPVTDSARTIVDCLLREAESAHVQVLTGRGLASVEPRESCFQIGLLTGEELESDRLLIATGGNLHSGGFEIATRLGHTVAPPVPSLFTFHVADPRIEGLQGVSVPEVEVTVPETPLKHCGALLITHWGFSGPAILGISAWGARVLHARAYRFPVRINWLPSLRREELSSALAGLRSREGRKQVLSRSPFALPLRLWKRLASVGRIDSGSRWGTLAKKDSELLAESLQRSEFQVSGKSRFKEEFVTCGGVQLNEVVFRTMESKLRPGLHFAGELIDTDGVTGGFNFQSAWTTGWIAGQGMAGDG